MQFITNLSFLVFGIAHGFTGAGFLAPLSLAFLALTSARPGAVSRSINNKIFVLIFIIAIYIIFIEIALGYGNYLFDVLFYRTHGKSLYMLGLIAILFFIPPKKFLTGLFWTFLGFITTVLIVNTYYILSMAPNLLYFTPETRFIIANIFGGHAMRGSYLCQVALFLFLVVCATKTKRKKIFFFMLFVWSIIVFLKNYARGASIGLVMGILSTYLLLSRRAVLATLFKKHKIIIVFIITIIAGGVIYYSFGHRFENMMYDSNVITRINLWKNALSIIKDNFFIGIGLGNFVISVEGFPVWTDPTVLNKGFASHNIYLQILVEQGIIGFMLWTAFFVLIWKKAMKVVRYERLHGAYGDIGIASPKFLAIFTISMINQLCVQGLTGSFSLIAPSTAFLLFMSLVIISRLDLNVGRENIEGI